MMHYVVVESEELTKEPAWAYRRESHHVYAVLERNGALVIRPEDRVEYRFPATYISVVAEKRLSKVLRPSQMFASSTFPHKEAEAQALRHVLGEVSGPLRKVHECYKSLALDTPLEAVDSLLRESSAALEAMDKAESFVYSRRKLKEKEGEKTYANRRKDLKASHDALTGALVTGIGSQGRYRAIHKILEGLSELEAEVNKLQE